MWALEAGGSWKIAGLTGAPVPRGCGNGLSISAGKRERGDGYGPRGNGGTPNAGINHEGGWGVDRFDGGLSVGCCGPDPVF